ncbi:TraB/GumN family protein [Massilia sp. TSP1-1-2]|uniref:TraB/GumN family protein n=1 Tax=Massilia sp. TSP1-1-2 TaxID=2804649 RepID=UPI003CF8B5A3
MWRIGCIALGALLSAPACALTQAAQAVVAAPDKVLVVGQRPGPGLWKISKGDHVLWVFAAYAPLPVQMQWRSQQVEAIVAQSQQYLAPPTAGTHVGLWKGLQLLPHVVGMRKNPGGAMLRDTVPADVYARWLVLKAKYGVGDEAESERPIFAAQTLYSAGLRHAGLSNNDDVAKAVGALVKKNKLKVMYSNVVLELADPAKTLKDFKTGSIDDAACFAKTIETLETDIDAMRMRANAWAKGDLGLMRTLDFADRDAACKSAMESSAAVWDGLGLQGTQRRMRKLWLEAADNALANNSTTFAMLKLDTLLKTDGLMADLQAKGYAVQAPD